MLAPFKGSNNKLLRARKHLRDLDNILLEYQRTLTFRFEPIAGDVEFETITFEPAPPNEYVALVAGDCVHNARSSLDLMVCDIARIRGKSTAKLKFPFAATKSDYEDLVLNGELRRLGEDVQQEFLFLSPYRGGDDLLRGLHDLDIADKHLLLLPVVECTFMQFDLGAHLSEVMGQNIAFFSGTGGASQRLLERSGGRVPVDPEYRRHLQKGDVTTVFGDNLPFAGNDVQATLDKMICLAGDIVERMSGKFS
ncbi:hypothetical protein FHT82_004588 [Rhizobium sp. BK275]|uniref:hypothetical protein n=1 Tax=Rhizobium sp. BK275 TaxID=2587077 RepID=UPI0016162B36|nr:hypothetical protein [Rhizobium sp. BK275]MBB3391810.1 hypothetical protein [Rhizobium sp. BK275]